MIEVCPSCGIQVGEGYMTGVSEYKGQEVCGFCAKKWKRLEERYGIGLSWEDFENLGKGDSFYKKIEAIKAKI